MDAAVIVGAIAGVVGAAVGAAGAVSASVVAGRQQNRGQLEHWRREMRRTAYAAFLNSAQEAHDRLSDLHSAMITADTVGVPADVRHETLTRLFGEARAAVERADRDQAVVELEGPRDVANSALRVTHVLALWITDQLDRWQPAAMNDVLRMLQRDRSTLSSGSEPDFPRVHLDQAAFVSRRIDAFTVSCRKTLGSE
ncbi:hypothetical protein AB0911_07975 [Streptomyces nigra]|uniref:hypothetical protein n=1 Tax=Streptomyces nigra TaxID=1827580 RepID=UPI003451A039